MAVTTMRSAAVGLYPTRGGLKPGARASVSTGSASVSASKATGAGLSRGALEEGASSAWTQGSERK